MLLIFELWYLGVNDRLNPWSEVWTPQITHVPAPSVGSQQEGGGMGDGEEQEVAVNPEYRASLGKDGEEKEAVWRLLKEEGRKGPRETRRAQASCHPTSLACSFVGFSFYHVFLWGPFYCTKYSLHKLLFVIRSPRACWSPVTGPGPTYLIIPSLLKI